MKNLPAIIIPEPASLTELAEGQKEEWGTTPCSTKENYRFKIEDTRVVYVGQGTISRWDYGAMKRLEREMRARYEQMEMDIEYRNQKALHESSLHPDECQERRLKEIPTQIRKKVEEARVRTQKEMERISNLAGLSEPSDYKGRH